MAVTRFDNTYCSREMSCSRPAEYLRFARPRVIVPRLSSREGILVGSSIFRAKNNENQQNSVSKARPYAQAYGAHFVGRTCHDDLCGSCRTKHEGILNREEQQAF